MRPAAALALLTAAVATALGTLAFVGLGAVLGQDQLVSGRLLDKRGVPALALVHVPRDVGLDRRVAGLCAQREPSLEVLRV